MHCPDDRLIRAQVGMMNEGKREFVDYDFDECDNPYVMPNKKATMDVLEHLHSWDD